MLNNKRHFAKSGAICVIKRKIYDDMAVPVDGRYLLEAAETAAHSRCKYYQSWFLHDISP